MIPIRWAKVKKGQEVYLRGTHLGKDVYYGPHRVVSPKDRILSNRQDYWFVHYPEELYLKESSDV